MKTVVITGASSGIGFETAKSLIVSGYRILMIGRKGQKTEDASEQLRGLDGIPEDQVEVFYADLGSRREVQDVIQELLSRGKPIDILINNAGVFRTRRTETTDGLEMNFSVNYLAAVQLSSGLIPLLEQTPGSRIILVSSEIYKNAKINPSDFQSEKKYSSSIAYANSKAMGLLFMRRVENLLKQRGISINAVHPGVASTEAFRDYPGIVVRLLSLFISTAEKAAGPVINIATDTALNGISGIYRVRYKQDELKIPGIATDGLADSVWKATRELLDGYSCISE